MCPDPVTVGAADFASLDFSLNAPEAVSSSRQDGYGDNLCRPIPVVEFKDPDVSGTAANTRMC